MARTNATFAGVQRLIAAGATALVAVATAAAFGRVFSSGGVTLKLIAVGLASAGVGAVLERRGLLLATTVSAVLLVLALGLAVFPETTWFGLPTLDTLRRIASSASEVGVQARVQVAPTAPLQPLVLAAVTAVWAAVFSAHALAFRAGSPLLALLPPVALVAFADTVLEDLVRPQYGIVFLIAGLAVVLSDGIRRIHGWGPVWGARESDEQRGSDGRRGSGGRQGSDGRMYRDAGRGARKVAGAAVACAIVSPLLIPGFGSSGLIDLATVNQDDRISLSPLVSIASELKRTQPFEVFRVRTPIPTYHRMIALTRFNGSTWAPPGEQLATPIGGDESLLPADVPAGTTLEQTYTISRSTRYPWLPVAYAPQSVDVDRDISLERATGTIWLDRFLDQGDSYTTESRTITPTPEQLDAVIFSATARTEAAVRLPADISPEIFEIADRWTRGAASTYREILAIQDRLRDQSRFTYSTEVPARGDSFTITDFLTETRTGFCQQFASAMAVLLRSKQIPARVAVGFTQGTPIANEPNTYRVTTDAYHSWVEVRFPVYGWLAFEPTPTRSNPVAAPYLAPAAPCQGPGCEGASGEAPGQQGTGAAGGSSLAEQLRRREGIQGRPGGPIFPTGPEVTPGTSPRTWLGAAAGVGLLLLALSPLVRVWRRRRRLHRAGSEPRQLILAQYDVFTDRARDLGWARPLAETPEEYRRKVTGSGTLSNGDLDRLTTLVTAAAYSRSEPGPGDAALAKGAASATLRDLRRATPIARRVVGFYRRRD